MKIVDFIKEHENWEDILIREPYFLKISRDSGFILFKYDTIHSDFSLDIVKEARGLILKEDTFEIVCYPFTKFFNVDEENADQIDWNTAQVQEKIDGSLMKVWYYDGRWRISTNGMIDAFKAPLSTDVFCKTFGELFMETFDTDYFSVMDKDCTYMFELVSPYNKIVVAYPTIDIYHIGTRNNKTGKEEIVNMGIKHPKVYPMTTEEQVKNAASKLPYNEEGYVVVDKDFHRVKIKSPAYVKAHRAITSKALNTRNILETIIEGEDKEFLSYFPEYKPLFNKVRAMYSMYKKHLEEVQNVVKEISEKTFSKKDFALALKETLPEDTDIGFALYTGKASNWLNFLEKQTINNIVERIEKYG